MLLLLFSAAGFASSGWRARVGGAPALPAEQVIEGEILEPPKVDAERVRFLLAVSRRFDGQWSPAQFAVRLSASPALPLRQGDQVRALAQLEAPPARANPGAADLPGRARAEGVLAYGVVRGTNLAVLGDGSAAQRWAARLREDFARLVEDASGSRPAAALIRALSLGDRADLDPEVNDDFAVSGLAHILSISGLHVAVVAAGLYKLLRWLLGRSERLLLATDVRGLASLFAIPATWAYVAAAGSEVPAVRSGVMVSALLLSRALRRDSDAPTSLGAALLAVLAWDPSALHSLTFQLSFASVAGLMLLSAPLRALVPLAPAPKDAGGWRARLRRVLDTALEAACASLAASLATAPLLAAAFHRASLVAVLANAAALPVASALTVLSAAAASLFALGGPAPSIPLLLLADPLSRALLFLSHLFASMPYASAWLRTPGTLATLAWYGLLLALPLWHWRAKIWRPLAIGATAALALCWAVPAARSALSHELRVTFLAVGQGDSTLIQFPDGRSLLIDGGGDPGGRFDPGERIVVPALLELGVRRPDFVALSHPHPDHVLGLLSVLSRLGAGELWTGPNREADLIRQLLAQAERAGASRRVISAGMSFDFGPARLEVLHPDASSQAEGNDSSLVLRARLGAVRFLLPGDVEREAERRLLLLPDLAAEVIKVPHHGSETSSSDDFIARVAPHHVVFCLGARNRFGFPRPSIVARYQAAGCQLHRTDRDGAITFSTDGVQLLVEHAL